MSDFDAKNESVETSAPIALVDSANIEPLVHTVRGQQIMLDTDLARLYEVETKNLNRAAARNPRCRAQTAPPHADRLEGCKNVC